MAIDVVFPLYEILVESIFGSVSLAIVGVAFALIIILALTKVGKLFLIYWISFFFIVMGAVYIGALALVFGFIIGGVYLFIAAIRLMFREN